MAHLPGACGAPAPLFEIVSRISSTIILRLLWKKWRVVVVSINPRLRRWAELYRTFSPEMPKANNDSSLFIRVIYPSVSIRVHPWLNAFVFVFDYFEKGCSGVVF